MEVSEHATDCDVKRAHLPRYYYLLSHAPLIIDQLTHSCMYVVLYLAMSPDGETIVTGAGDETLRFWRAFPKKKLAHGGVPSTVGTGTGTGGSLSGVIGLAASPILGPSPMALGNSASTNALPLGSNGLLNLFAQMR